MSPSFSELNDSISRLGRDHKHGGLDRTQLDPDPFVTFAQWLEDALKAGITLPNAMTLATAGADHLPSARMVLLKEVDASGFVFYSNFDSRKGQDLASNPNAALVFYWSELERQVRVTGGVLKVDKSEAEAYFNSRPLASKIGAWASPQSEVISSRDALEARFAELQVKYQDGMVPLPPHWGGSRLLPTHMEFWQSRPNRLHDRFLYKREPGSGWALARLAP